MLLKVKIRTRLRYFAIRRAKKLQRSAFNAIVDDTVLPDLVYSSAEDDSYITDSVAVESVPIYVKLPVGGFSNKYFRINMNVTCTIFSAKTQVFLHTGILESDQRLFWSGACLEDFKTFQDYGMTRTRTYFADLVVGLNGGESESEEESTPDDASASNVSRTAYTVSRVTRLRPMTWRFDFRLQMPALSDLEEVRVASLQILEDACKKSAIKGLKQSSFSYDVPGEGCLANISGYLHGSEHINDSFVKRWIIDDRIREEIVWTPVVPGRRGDWKQQPPIKGIFAACEHGGTRRLHDWVGKSSDGVAKGGRPKKAQAPSIAGEGGASAADAGTAARRRGRPAKPLPVPADSPVQAAVRKRLNSIRSDALNEICKMICPEDRAWVGQPNSVRVELLMRHHLVLADELGIAVPAADTPDAVAANPPPQPADTPDLAALHNRLQDLHFNTLEQLCISVFPPPDISWRGLYKGPLMHKLMTQPVKLGHALDALESTPAPTQPAAGSGRSRSHRHHRRQQRCKHSHCIAS